MFEFNRKLFIIVLVMHILACARDRNSSSGGGVIDGGGGGDFVFSTQEEVEQSVRQVWALYLDGTASNPLNVAYRLLEQKIHPVPDDFKVARILRNVLKINGSVFLPVFGTDAASYLRDKVLLLPSKELCKGPHDHKFVASVTKLDRKGELCMSIYGLMRLPTGALHSDILALFAHEIAHLNGYGEDDARLLQKFFLKEHKDILRKGSQDVRSRFAFAFWSDVTNRWPALINYGSINKIYFRRLQELQFETHKAQNSYFFDIIPGDDIEVARPDLWPSTRNKLNSWREQLKTFGVALGKKYDQDHRARLNSADFQTVKNLAMGLVELQRQVDLFFFGHAYESRDEEYFTAELNLIERATDLGTLTNPKLRPVIFCPVNADLGTSTWGKAHPIYNELFERRCALDIRKQELKRGPIAIEFERELEYQPRLPDELD